MVKSNSTISHKTGLPPGSLVYLGASQDTTSRLSALTYNLDGLQEKSLRSLDELDFEQPAAAVTWVVVEGLTDINIIESVGKRFQIHPLVLEDILNPHQRPKFEEYNDYLYIVLKALIPTAEKFAVHYEQISILVLKDFVFVFKEKIDGLFSPVRQRIENDQSRFRTQGSDYLTYAILDLIVDGNFTLLDALAETIDNIEEELLREPDAGTLRKIQAIKREITHIHRFISPLRELLSSLLRSDSPLIKEKNLIYFRDVHDHAIRVSESVDLYRDILSGLLDIYISSVSNRMNEVMKVLTVFASIFIPLTFITGIYGMNFEFMPELKWRWGYPSLWLAFVGISLGLLVYFKRKKWL
ncbi:MAG: magnesium/cobalt transporter CorA [Deltaproteobacteria bacterium]|nr:magnesium/cobalt transporter CorA [Deltaproteobacteria bacterium]